MNKNYMLPKDKISLNDDNSEINGIKLLDLFKEEILKEDFRYDPNFLWNLLGKYLSKDEEVDFFIAWEKIKIGHGINDFQNNYFKIRDRMRSEI